jgi:Di-haem oxidoreductase, putative peroxidase
VFDPARGHFNRLFATAPIAAGQPFGHRPGDCPEGAGFSAFRRREHLHGFKRHDLGSNFHERQYDGTVRTQFLTTPLWGVGSTAPYGHDGRSINLTEVILRHGGEAQATRDAFAALPSRNRDAVIAFLNSLIIFPPDDTASNLDPGDRSAAGFPQYRHGSIRLTGLFNNPSIIE